MCAGGFCTVLLAALAATTASAAEIDLTFCMDPLILRDSLENPYDCSQTQVPYVSESQLRALLGDPDPIGFCILPASESGFTACTRTCDLELQTGCFGTITSTGLVINASESKICGNYIVEVADIDVHYSILSCSLRMLADGSIAAELQSTYAGPLSWQINSANTQLSNVDVAFSGCGSLGAVLGLVTDFFTNTVNDLVEQEFNDALTQEGGLRVCPMDSLHPEYLPAPH